jgi:hypothetical protein
VKKPHNRLIPVLTFLKYRYYTSPGIENSIPNWKHYYQWGNETYHSINHAVFKGDVNYVSTSAADIRTIWPHHICIGQPYALSASNSIKNPWNWRVLQRFCPWPLHFRGIFLVRCAAAKLRHQSLKVTQYTSCSLKIDAKNIFLCLKTSLPNLARIENN